MKFWTFITEKNECCFADKSKGKQISKRENNKPLSGGKKERKRKKEQKKCKNDKIYWIMKKRTSISYMILKKGYYLSMILNMTYILFLILSIILYITSSIGWENTSRVQWEFKLNKEVQNCLSINVIRECHYQCNIKSLSSKVTIK